MLWSMDTVFLVLVFVAYAGHGRRVNMFGDRMSGVLNEEPQIPLKCDGQPEARGQLKGLAALLTASNLFHKTDTKSKQQVTNFDAKLFVQRAKLPVCIGVGCGVAAVGAYQVKLEIERREEELIQLQDDVQTELKALRKLTQSRQVEAPLPDSQMILFRIDSERKVLEELRARKTVIEECILPKLTQLYGSNLKQALKLGDKPVSQRSSAELADLNNTLAARIEASCLLYDEYESIGQVPPDNLNVWPLAKLQGLLEDMTSKRTELREVVKLYGQLRRRMDRSVIEWSADRLREHVLELNDQFEEEKKATEKLNLLSQVEALMMERGNEMAINSLRSLSVAELTALLAKLQGKDAVAVDDLTSADQS